MSLHFEKIGIIGHHPDKDIGNTLHDLISLLSTQAVEILLEQRTAKKAQLTQFPALDTPSLATQADLVICIGGDGSMLTAARDLVPAGTPLLGINRGNLGFLTDILPETLSTQLLEILTGHYHIEHRFVLAATLFDASGSPTFKTIALNDVVLRTDTIHMLSFEVFIDDHFVHHQHADGQIVATPTGSTAYALSGGGPIVDPDLTGMVLVPMFPHNLTSRPLVIPQQKQIDIVLNHATDAAGFLSCDGAPPVAVGPGSRIRIGAHDQTLALMHPLNYDYFQTLRAKLHWQTRNTG